MKTKMTDQGKRAKYLAETSTADRCRDAMNALGYVGSSWSSTAADRTVAQLADEGIAATIIRDDGQYLVVVEEV